MLNYNNYQITIECIDSIISTCCIPYEIIVVDNGSKDDSVIRFKECLELDKYKDIVLIESKENGGFSKGNNLGFDYCYNKLKCDYVVISNNDVIFQNNCIENLVNVLKENNNCIVSIPKIKDINSNYVFEPYTRKNNFFQLLEIQNNRNNTMNWNEIEGVTKVYSFSGCCFAVNAKLFNEIGRFDENVFLYYEESIVAEKCEKKHFDILVSPNAEIIHNQGTTTGKQNPFVDTENLKSLIYYLRVYRKYSKFKLFVFFESYKFKMLLKVVAKKYENGIKLREYFKDLNIRYQEVIKYKN